jgi:regulator of protease activity HflC (stomatin/prohibitin superfamily)
MFITVEPNEVIIIKSFGKIREVISKPGLNCRCNIVGRELLRVRTCLETLTIKDCSFPDSRGSPLRVSAIINYRIVDALQASFAVDVLNTFI